MSFGPLCPRWSTCPPHCQHLQSTAPATCTQLDRFLFQHGLEARLCCRTSERVSCWRHLQIFISMLFPSSPWVNPSPHAFPTIPLWSSSSSGPWHIHTIEDQRHFHLVSPRVQAGCAGQLQPRKPLQVLLPGFWECGSFSGLLYPQCIKKAPDVLFAPAEPQGYALSLFLTWRVFLIGALTHEPLAIAHLTKKLPTNNVNLK